MLALAVFSSVLWIAVGLGCQASHSSGLVSGPRGLSRATYDYEGHGGLGFSKKNGTQNEPIGMRRTFSL